MEKEEGRIFISESFFDHLTVKRLRSVAGGDTYTIVYIKILMKASLNEWEIPYMGLCCTLAEEIALDQGETTETITALIRILKECGIIEYHEQEYIRFNHFHNMGICGM